MCFSGTCPWELWSGDCGKRPNQPCPEMEEDEADMKYEIHKTTVLGVGPWYVSPEKSSEVCGVFRKKSDAVLFARAKEDAEK